MEVSILVARILSVVYLSFALGLIFSREYYKKEISKFIDNSGLVLYGGFMAIVFGCLIVYYHNIWSRSWTTIITVVGWIALLKGVVLLIFPRGYVPYKGSILSEKNLYKILLPLALTLGLLFAYFGFIHS